MNSGRFAISVHILSLLSLAKDEWVASEYLAGSINVNAVLVRKELANLRIHGLVLSKEGRSGGSKLARSADQILMSEVYSAVRRNDLLGKGINTPNPDCIVGRKINDHLDSFYEEAEKTLLFGLGQVSLADFCQEFK